MWRSILFLLLNITAGGFYQDEIAQTVPTQSKWDIPCKLCNEGTYVKEGHGTAAKDCEVCPEGTNQSINAGFRACYCKENYARTDRYGPCSICVEEGLDCRQDFKSILPGYMWNWSFRGANLSNYNAFVANLTIDYNNASIPTKYLGAIPRIFKCPRSESCPNDNGMIAGNCAKGYKGWLCSNCESGYYSVLNSCIACPSVVILIIESCVFLVICLLACFMLTWQIKRKAKTEYNTRSFIDVILARIKLLLGFYQVVGEIFTSLHDIKWTGPLAIIGKFISTFEINILRLFVRPRCVDESLELTPKAQILIGAMCPLVIVIISYLVYHAKKLYVYIKYSAISRTYFLSQFENLKECLFACVIVLCFIIYPPVCSVIFSLYPLSCKSFNLDHNNTYSITRLRADLDVDCTGLGAYQILAFILTFAYVIAFPAALLYILRRNVALSSMAASAVGDPDSPSPSTWITFLCENYKRKFWYWEIVELVRKVTQTLLITLFGWEDRLTVILTTCISVLFLFIHARYRPMTSTYEQGLQVSCANYCRNLYLFVYTVWCC